MVNSTMQQICLACTDDGNSIAQLRIEEFNRSSDFKLLKPQLLEWGKMDEQHEVVVVWDKGHGPAATMRFVRVDDEYQASQVIEADLPPGIAFPAVVFNAAATRKSHRGRGINQLLRYHGILAALEQGIQSLLSPVYQSAPRYEFLQELGYVCHEMTHTWQTKLAPRSPRMLCVLDRADFLPALARLESSSRDLINQVPWTGPPLTLEAPVPEPAPTA